MRIAIAVAASSLLLVSVAGVGGCGPGSQGDSGTSGDSGSGVVRYTFRAIGGVSMGGAGAAMLGLAAADDFDVVMALGTSLDTNSYLRRVRSTLLGGFCDPPVAGTSCPPADGSTHFEDFGPDSVGFDREGLLLGFSDAALAFGNWMWHSTGSPYLPAGVPLSHLDLTPAERCATPLVFSGYYDARWNPDGGYDVITFCDGAEAPGTDTAFDPMGVHDLPVDYLLAVDLDGDGLRGVGEPLLIQASEPFDDFGADGTPSSLEPGFDVVSNPDPAGDDYGAATNATGTEGNGRWEMGEPYSDFGFDGVDGTAVANPLDAGEGNGVFDVTSNRDHLDALDPARLVGSEDLSRLGVWVDVGIRDELGFYEDTLAFVGKAAAAGTPFDRFDGFESIPYDGSGEWDVRDARFEELGSRVLVVYGDPNATPAEIAAGDGGHIDAPRVLNRIVTAIAYAGSRWPLERTAIAGPGRDEVGTFYSAALDSDRELVVHLPPGYDDDPERRHPVIYFLHGFGMRPDDLIAVALFADALVNAGTMPSFLLVMPSGNCGGIECDTGSFFINHAGFDGDGARFGDMMLQDLVAHIDATYRTLPEAELPPP